MTTNGSGQLSWQDQSASGGGWIDDGADVRLQATADSVGIGTSDPHLKLHIVSTGAAHQLRLESTGSGGGYWSIGQSDDGFSSGGGALDVNSTSGALIVPRMTTTQRDALTPLNGMIIYNTTNNQFNFYENGAWVTK